jgi:hypothetical protein
MPAATVTIREAAPVAKKTDTYPSRRHIAYHEAGHAVAAYLLGEPIIKVSIKPERTRRGLEYGGMTVDAWHVPGLFHAIDAWLGPLAEVRQFGFKDSDAYGDPNVVRQGYTRFFADLGRRGGSKKGRWPWRRSRATLAAWDEFARCLAADLLRSRKVQAAIGVVARRLLEVEELDGRAVRRLLAPRLKPLFRWPRPWPVLPPSSQGVIVTRDLQRTYRFPAGEGRRRADGPG